MMAWFSQTFYIVQKVYILKIIIKKSSRFFYHPQLVFSFFWTAQPFQKKGLYYLETKPQFWLIDFTSQRITRQEKEADVPHTKYTTVVVFLNTKKK